MTAIYRTWLERLSLERIPHHQVIQLCRAVHPLAKGRRVGGKKTNLTPAEAADIIGAIESRARRGDGIRATSENEERGRDWLCSNRKRLGLPADLDPRQIADFRLVGFHEYPRKHDPLIEPLWRCSLDDGRMFEYAPGAWQVNLGRHEAIDWFHWAWVSP